MKTKKNILFSLVLCAALILGSVVNPMITEATAQATTSETYDVSEYRSGSTYTYPEKMGYIFAGWYTDNTYATALGADVKEGTAYAKFIDEDILGVRCQILSDTTVDDGETIMRIVTGIDDGDYAKIGFKFKFDSGAEFTYATTDVYTSIYGYVDENSTEYVPADVFEGASYFAGVDISAFTKNYFDDSLTITALLRTQDGTTVEGKMKRMSVVDGVNVYAGNVAKIGDTYYADFTSALSAANANSDATTIELIKDADYKNATAGNIKASVTINGNGNQLTATGDSQSIFDVATKGVYVNVENLKIAHSSAATAASTVGGMLLRYNGSALVDNNVTTTWRNVSVDSTSDYKWACLINCFHISGTMTFDFDDVDIKWVSANAYTEGGIFRTGNATTASTDRTDANIIFDFDSCNFDSSGCSKNMGAINAYEINKVTVELENTYINSTASYAIKCHDGNVKESWQKLTVTHNNLELASGKTLFSDSTKVFKVNVTDADGNVTGTWYSDFASALTAAKGAVGDVLLLMYQDGTHTTSSAYKIADVEFSDKDIVINGNDHKLTTAGAGNSFQITQTSGSFTLKNMDIDHGATAILARTDNVVGLYFEDLNITTTGYDETTETEDGDSDTYQYCLVNALNAYDRVLSFKDVDIKMVAKNKPINIDTNGNEVSTAPAIIRTGNDSETKTVTIYMDGCTIDGSEAKWRPGIRIMKNTTAEVHLKDTNMVMMNDFAVYTYTNATATDSKVYIYGDNVSLTRMDASGIAIGHSQSITYENVDVSTWPLQ